MGRGLSVTGLVLDAIHGQAPPRDRAYEHPLQGMKKGVIYSGTFMGILNGVVLLAVSRHSAFPQPFPLAIAMTLGAMAFPLLKTIVETFDGSQAFFRRVRSYRNPTLYVAGRWLDWGWDTPSRMLCRRAMTVRAWFGFGVGVAAFAGVDLLRDVWAATRPREAAVVARLTSWMRFWVVSSGRPSGSISTRPRYPWW